MTKYLRNSSKIILDAAARMEQNGDLPDLIVNAGESRVLSSRAEQSRPFYHEFKPSSAAEVKDLLGIPDDMAIAGVFNEAELKKTDKAQLKVRSQAPSKMAAEPALIKRVQSVASRNIRPLPGKIIAINRLTDEDVDADEKLENHALARAATEAYVYGSSLEVASWIPLIEAYLEKLGPKVFVPIFRNITVNNNATLNIASDTLAVYANRIRLYGNGKINCSGPKTFHCTSFEGFL